jgi:hypothetical protein
VRPECPQLNAEDVREFFDVLAVGVEAGPRVEIDEEIGWSPADGDVRRDRRIHPARNQRDVVATL